MKVIGLLMLLIGTSVTSLVAQSKNDKALIGIEEKYTNGDYAGAIKALEKWKKKAFKKLGQQNAYTPTYFLYQAKYHLASGYIQEFEAYVQQAISSSLAVNKEASPKHVILLMDVANLYAQTQSFQQALEHLENAKKIMDANALATEELKARYDVDRAEIRSGQGYYKEALELLNSREDYFVRRAVKQESYVDDKGALKSRRLSEPEQIQRFNEYARLLTLLGKTLGDQGDQRKSDEYFGRANDWIEKNLGSSSTAAIRNRLLLANTLVEYGVSNARDTDYGKLLNSLKIRHKASHVLGMDVYNGYMKQLIREDASSAKYQNVKLEFEKIVKGAFKENSIHRIRLKAAEFDSRLDRAKTKNLEGQAIALLSSPGLPRNNPITIQVLDFLYGLSIYNKNYTNAEKYLNDVLEIKKNLYGEEAPMTHLSRTLLANFYLDYTNKIPEATKIYESSYLQVLANEIGSWQNDHLNILNHMAALYEITDNFKEASKVLERAENVAREKYDNEDRLFAEELTNNARLLLKLGEYEKAEEKLLQARKVMELKKNSEFKEVIIGIIETQAVLYGIKGQFSEAEDELDRSERIIRKSDKLIGIDQLSTAKELSSLFIQLGRYAQTEDLLDNLVAEYEKLYGKNSLRLVEPLVNKGRLALAKGDYTQAERLAQRANQIALSVYKETSTKTAPTQKLISDIDYIIGDYDNAERNILKAVRAQESQFGRQHVETARSLSQLSLIKFYKGDDKKEVEKIMTESRKTIGDRLGTDNPTYAEILKNLAVLYISQKRYNEAFGVLTQAEAIWRSKTGSKNNINTAAIFTLTGDVYYQIKNYSNAEKFYVQAKEIYEKYFSDTHPEYVKILSKEAKVDYMQKDFKRAKRNIEQALNSYEAFIKQYFPALSEREKAKYWNTIRPDFEFYNTLAFSQLDDFKDLTGKVYNYQLLTKALLLSSSIKIRERILNSKNQPLIDAFTKWLRDKEFATKAQSMSAQQLAENGIDMAALNNEIDRLEKELSEKSELFGQSFENKRITYENVQKSLAKNEVAVEMVRYRHFDHSFTDSIIYVAMYVRNDGARPKVIEFPQGHRMESNSFKYYRNCIISKIEDERSYKTFWEPIEKGVGQYTTLYLSPDGVYNQINLEAIPIPGSEGKFIIDNSNIVLVNNTKDLYLKKLKSKPGVKSNSASMFGNPIFYVSSKGGDVDQLPGTEKEVMELQRLLKQNGWKTTEYVEQSASEEKIKNLDSPSILHIATHGFYSPSVAEDVLGELTENEAEMTQNPLLKTGLLLTGAGDILNKTKFNYNLDNGILTAHEAMSLNLDKTDLVVLSACETGLGEITNGEGVYGLQRAFLVAGAKVLIMSMFKVDDEATQKLISSFYRKWITTGNQRQSFIDAKKELRAEYPDPIYWGAFMMIGLE